MMNTLTPAADALKTFLDANEGKNFTAGERELFENLYTATRIEQRDNTIARIEHNSNTPARYHRAKATVKSATPATDALRFFLEATESENLTARQQGMFENLYNNARIEQNANTPINSLLTN